MGRKENHHSETRTPQVLQHADGENMPETSVTSLKCVHVIPVISEFLGHAEDEDQQALYPVITVSHP